MEACERRPSVLESRRHAIAQSIESYERLQSDQIETLETLWMAVTFLYELQYFEHLNE